MLSKTDYTYQYASRVIIILLVAIYMKHKNFVRCVPGHPLYNDTTGCGTQGDAKQLNRKIFQWNDLKEIQTLFANICQVTR